ncbi:MAG: carbonic anhydrase family protein, partial [Chlorobi bacterium]|nr:carbonic anhydrase family protein [Chlorobiota bacterium]
LLQFHYHALSEHTVNGKYFPLEVHFVHMHSDTDFVVLGVMIEEGAENELFKSYLDKFPTEKGEYKSENKINLMSLLPENKSYFNYKGSLTTPPCTEVVDWYVLQNSIYASKEQIEKFSQILNDNYRPVQALNGRKVYSFKE